MQLTHPKVALPNGVFYSPSRLGKRRLKSTCTEAYNIIYYIYIYIYMCVCVCVCACARACVCVCVCVKIDVVPTREK